jgi:hypothetical protein
MSWQLQRACSWISLPNHITRPRHIYSPSRLFLSPLPGLIIIDTVILFSDSITLCLGLRLNVLSEIQLLVLFAGFLLFVRLKFRYIWSSFCFPIA